MSGPDHTVWYRHRDTGDHRTNRPLGGLIPVAMPVPILVLRTPIPMPRPELPAMPVGGFFGTVPTTYLRVPNLEFDDPEDVTVGSTSGDRHGDISIGATGAGSTVTTASGVAHTVTGAGAEIVTTGTGIVIVATVVDAGTPCL